MSFLVGIWWLTLLPCFVLSSAQEKASELALDILLKARVVLQQKASCILHNALQRLLSLLPLA